MPESLRKQVWRIGGLGWTVRVSALAAWTLVGWTLAAGAPPALAAESLPASIRACAALTDSLQRLVCYDREVARFPDPAAQTAPKPAPSTPPPVAAKSAPVPSDSAQPRASANSTTAATNTGAALGTDKATAQATTKDAGRISARVVSIDRQPNEMVLHLDNGQVWQEVQGVSGDLSLREGDTVKIEKHLGAYWLSGPHVSSMKVRQIS
jgi:hypothetical protein